jgi:hypothetical protein
MTVPVKTEEKIDQQNLKSSFIPVSFKPSEAKKPEEAAKPPLAFNTGGSFQKPDEKKEPEVKLNPFRSASVQNPLLDSNQSSKVAEKKTNPFLNPQKAATTGSNPFSATTSSVSAP